MSAINVFTEDQIHAIRHLSPGIFTLEHFNKDLRFELQIGTKNLVT